MNTEYDLLLWAQSRLNEKEEAYRLLERKAENGKEQSGDVS